MEFNIIEVTSDYYGSLSKAQRRVLREAQKKKDALEHKADKEIAGFKRYLYTNGMQNSSLLEHKKEEISKELNYEIGIIREQLLYSLDELHVENPDDGDYSDVGYVVDFSLSYTDRYIAVRDYYMSIPDPYKRVELYVQDEVARKYLGKYYESLYNVLLTYCK